MSMTRFLAIAAILGLLIGGSMAYKRFYNSDSSTIQFRTEKVTRGDLHITVRATGTVEPEETVDVGAQVVGRIAELGKDPRGAGPSTTSIIKTPAILAASTTAAGQSASSESPDATRSSDAAETPAENRADVATGANSTIY